MNPTTLQIVAAILFGCAILHTFTASRFQRLGHRYPKGSVGENFFETLGEVEVVFGLWAGFLVIGMCIIVGGHEALAYLEQTGTYAPTGDHPVSRYTEPAFVFAIMTVAATRPVLVFANGLIDFFAKLIPADANVAFFVSALVIGPLLGSYITEPAAMTVTALILKERYYDQGISRRLMYMTLGVLFVNISIGGTLSHFAAPPVLMVAGTWDWDMAYMITHFGWKAALAVLINASVLAFVFRKELTALTANEHELNAGQMKSPVWLIVLHLVFLAGIVAFAHHMVIFLGFFLFFLGVAAITDEYQDELKLKEGLLVGFFLAGLVTLGGLQAWWLEPIITDLGDLPLFLGTTGLTAVTDNAALTYLGTTVNGLSEAAKFSLVAGAVAGGGLTVIANAPNPAGYGILKDSFGDKGISALGLLGSALLPTLVAMACLWLLPSL